MSEARGWVETPEGSKAFVQASVYVQTADDAPLDENAVQAALQNAVDTILAQVPEPAAVSVDEREPDPEPTPEVQEDK